MALKKHLAKIKSTSKIYSIFTLSDISNIETQRKQILAYVFLITGGTIGLIFAAINYLNGEYTVILVDLLLPIAAFILFPLVKNQKLFKKTSLALVLVFYFLVTLLLFLSYENIFYSLWFLTTPPVFIFLLGNKLGTFISLTNLVVFFLEYTVFPASYPFPKEYFSRVLTIYFIILLLILIYEHTRKTAQTALQHHKGLLDNTISTLDKQQVEYIKIMKNVTDGIFLLDQNLKIKLPYSSQLKNILSIKFIKVGSSFISILEGKIFKSKLVQLERYLNEIIKTGRIPTNIANPIQKIIMRTKHSKEQKVKTLSFAFTTIPVKNGTYEILGKVIDISKEVHLEKKLNEQKAKKIQEVERLMTITHIHPEDLNEFIKSSYQKLIKLRLQAKETRLASIHHSIPHNSQDHPQLALMTSMLSDFHAIKGNASVIGFISFAELTHRYETEIQTLKKPFQEQQSTLSETQQDQLNASIESLLKEITTTETIVHKLGEFNYQYTKLSEKFGIKFSKFIYRAIQASKQAHHPPVKLVSKHFNENIFIHHETFYETVKDIFILLIKNSLVHGIESLSERAQLKKDKTAIIKITSTTLKNNMIKLSYSDDGKGLNLERIKEQLRKTNNYDEAQINAMSASKLYASIFNKEFSTRTTTSLDAGRGMGLYFVKETVKALGGSLEIFSTAGKGTKFTFLIPVPVEIKTTQEPEKTPAYS